MLSCVAEHVPKAIEKITNILLNVQARLRNEEKTTALLLSQNSTGTIELMKHINTMTLPIKNGFRVSIKPFK